MTSNSPEHVKEFLNSALGLFTDPRFDYAASHPSRGDDLWKQPVDLFANLAKRKAAFISKNDYDWALDRAAYNTPYEMLLQWRLLNVISDIDAGHPHLTRCKHIVVRRVPSSCATPHVRVVDQYKVVVLTNGYVSMLKGFLRVWLVGCALGKSLGVPQELGARCTRAEFLRACENDEARLKRAAMAYCGSIVQLLENQLPVMDEASLFDDELLSNEDYRLEFGILSSAIDGFLVFHEVAHVLGGDLADLAGIDRSIDVELGADTGSISLCIIDEAVNDLRGAVYLGAPLFFAVELLRLLVSGIGDINEGRGNDSASGISELMQRSQLYRDQAAIHLGGIYGEQLEEWQECVLVVFNVVRWALLNLMGQNLNLSDFLRKLESDAAN